MELTPEGRLLLKPLDKSQPQPGESRVTPSTMWTRVIIVEGPSDWVDECRRRALADGVHTLGPDGRSCRVETTGYDAFHHHSIPTPTGAVIDHFERTDPTIKPTTETNGYI